MLTSEYPIADTVKVLAVALVVAFLWFSVWWTPSLIGPGRGRIRIATVKSDMHTLLLAAESYATDTAGEYARTGRDLLPYLPGGSNTREGRAGILPANCILIHITPSAFSRVNSSLELKPIAVRSQIAHLDDRTHWVGYCGLPDASGKLTSFAVVGGEGTVIAHSSFNKVMILSNQ